MKAVKTIILILISSIVFGQDITFSTKEEVAEVLEYVNKMRYSKEFIKQETGTDIKWDIASQSYTMDSTLCKLAKKRITEIIERDKFGHHTKYDLFSKGINECIAYTYNNDLKSHIKIYVKDEGLDWKGHRYFIVSDQTIKKVGFAYGLHKGKLYSCLLGQQELPEGYHW